MPRFDPHPDRRPAVVTGASSGIGRATAVALAALGHPVVLGARRVERCEEAATEIRDAGGEAVAVQPITVAGADPAEFTRQVGVNLLGPQALVHHLVPPMVERRRGDVVIVTSEVSIRPRPNMAAYVASKSGLEGMADALRMELEGTGVRVGVVRPGPASTEQGTTWSAADIDEVMATWSRWGLLRHGGYLRPADVAAAVTAIVGTPRGTQLAIVEVQPEAPIEGPADDAPGGQP